METLFSLYLHRPGAAPDPRYPALRLAQVSDYQKALSTAGTNQPTSSAARGKMVELSNNYIASPNFMPLDPDIADNKQLDALDAAIVPFVLKADNDPTPVIHRSEVISAMKDALGGVEPQAWMATDVPTKLRARLKDSMVAIKTVSAESPGHLEKLAARLHAQDTVEKLVRDGSFPISKSDLARWVRRPLVAPSFADFESIISAAAYRDQQRQKRAADLQLIQERIKAIYNQYKESNRALNGLMKIPASQYRSMPARQAQPYKPPVNLAFDKGTIAQRHLDLLNGFADLTRKQFEMILERGMKEVPGAAETTFERAGTSSLVSMSSNLLQEARMLSPQSGTPSYTPVASNLRNGTLKPEVLQNLPANIVATLNSKGIKISETPLPTVVKNLRAELTSHAMDLDKFYKDNMALAQGSTITIGGISFMPPSRFDNRWRESIMNDDDEPPMLHNLLEDSEFSDNRSNLIPHAKGKITISGVSDLLIVKQQLVNYEGADVASIETILRGETREHETTTTQTTERFTLNETETTTTEEKDTTRADRFETSIESNNVIQSQSALSGGLTLSGSYGPMVSFTANAQGSMSQNKQEAIKTANNFSKEITEKASKKIQSRVLTRSTLKITNEVVDRTKHAYSVSDSKPNVNGVYQFVNKIYEAQTFKYGMRVQAEFMIPEPGAFLLNGPNGNKQQTLSVPVSHPQAVPSLKSITPDGIDNLAAKFQVFDLEPAPDEHKWASASHNNPTSPADSTLGYSDDIVIPEGYQVETITGNFVHHDHSSDDTQVSYVIGPTEGVNLTTEELQQGTIPFSPNLGDYVITDKLTYQVVTRNVASWSIAIELLLKRTQKALSDWQLKTWNKLEIGRKQLQDTYDEAVRQAREAATAALWAFHGGVNPADNMITMRQELKKACISLITEQHFEGFHAVNMVQNPAATKQAEIYAEIDTARARAEGVYVRFFEEAFEWENLVYLLYPYFWGRKESWFDRLNFVDNDPALQEFMRAGYARVNVPIRPGFEGALDHFLSTGDVWMGGPLPAIGSELFVPIASEIAERLGKPAADEETYGEPWKVTVPTALVTLRADDKTPTWEKKEGKWVPVPIGPAPVSGLI